jgi:hypothetical protein
MVKNGNLSEISCGHFFILSYITALCKGMPFLAIAPLIWWFAGEEMIGLFPSGLLVMRKYNPIWRFDA